MGDVIQIEPFRNRHWSELICLRCRSRERHVWPCGTPMRALECGECRAVGFLIATGDLGCGDPEGICPFTPDGESA